MKITGNYYSYAPQRTTFGTNQGVLNAIERLKENFTSNGRQELYVQAKTINFSDRSFIKKINELDDLWKEVLIQSSPKDIQEKLKNLLN